MVVLGLSNDDDDEDGVVVKCAGVRKLTLIYDGLEVCIIEAVSGAISSLWRSESITAPQRMTA